ncbi:Dolichyl-diphosphooligosaccharide--protein glycosyltransferase 48 kDa subunit [Camellia lanceoleosa]|uniref:Dolichyl-diphosphooligosaccharide--protein glycosyltransferase 48 kDa subunit n=1 Tax=Camellia lanceoleosa TaxID=1840588 RepID=A0ACC0GSS0_9ERIC|nr:Dolichyl-diphosphooligosaccharide--protein glycosyltransferase 48 kDa subunit [Camellia lanceoleosa]
MANLCITSLIFLSFLPIICLSFSPENPTDRRILVLLDDFALKSSHSIFFKALQNRRFELDFKLADDRQINLQRYGQYMYDGLAYIRRILNVLEDRWIWLMCWTLLIRVMI